LRTPKAVTFFVAWQLRDTPIKFSSFVHLRHVVFSLWVAMCLEEAKSINTHFSQWINY